MDDKRQKIMVDLSHCLDDFGIKRVAHPSLYGCPEESSATAMVCHWKELGYDFAPLMEMLDFLPDRAKKTWHGILADSTKLERFFDAVFRCRMASSAAKHFREKYAATENHRDGEQLQPSVLREECRNMAEQATVMRKALIDIIGRLLYRFDETTLLDVFSEELHDIPFRTGFQEISEVYRYCHETLGGIVGAFRKLGYDGEPWRIKGSQPSAYADMEGTKEGADFISYLDKLALEELQENGILPMDSPLPRNPFHVLAQKLSSLTEVKEHARMMLLVVRGYLTDSPTLDTMRQWHATNDRQMEQFFRTRLDKMFDGEGYGVDQYQ